VTASRGATVKKWIPATLIVVLMGAGAGAYLLTREDKHCVPFGTMGKIVDILTTQPTEEAAHEITRLLDVNVVAMYQEADGDFFEFSRLLDREIAHWEQEGEQWCRQDG